MNNNFTDSRNRGLYQYLNSLGSRVERYGNASHGFKDTLLFLKEQSRIERPNVVMPAFIPSKLYRTLVSAGYEPKFYDIRNGCRFDPQEVEDLIDKRTTSIFAIHYFGHPADMASLTDTARRKNVALIEDCAHVLLGKSDGKTLGTLGDFSIFSARKMLLLSDGGLLLLNREYRHFKPSFGRRVRSVYTASKFVTSRVKYAYLRVTGGRDIFHVARPVEIGLLEPGRRLEVHVMKTSHLTALFGKTADIYRNSALRKDNYMKLYRALGEFDFLRPLYDDMPECWTPYSLPVEVNGKDRAVLEAALVKRGVSCGLGWPESPLVENHRNLEGTRRLASSLIEFPIHPLVVEQQFEKIVDACESVAKKNGHV